MGSRIVGVIVALSISGSVAWAAATGPPHSKYPKPPGHGYGGKVTICHKVQGKKKHHPRYITIKVSRKAVRAHLRHGDKLGRCRRH